MNTRELADRLLNEGCNPLMYAIESRGAASDAFCLTRSGSQWKIYYTERGCDSPPICVSDSESQACEYFFSHIMAMRHDHCVGFFKSKENAEALQGKLQKLGLSPWSDQIPYSAPSDLRFRVFVTGKAIFGAQSALGKTPVHDPGA